jgi:hypothetical protein
MREAEIEERVCRYAKAKGFSTYKFTSPGRRSVPDRLFLAPGKFFAVEFKAEGKKPTAGQAREHNRLRELGVPVYVCDSVPSGLEIVDREIAGDVEKV